MDFTGKTAVVLGAAGVIGSGIVRRYLDAGARVVGVSRSADNLVRLTRQMGISQGEPFLPVVGDFQDEAGAARARRAVDTALAGGRIDHVVTVLGFVSPARAPTETPLELLRGSLEDGLFNNFLAARVFLPEMKAVPGTSFTLVSGGLAHIPPPMPPLWLGTVKNAALNALTLALAAETAQEAVQVNTLCIHFGVAPPGGSKNQFGMPTEGDTLRLAPAFLGVARGTQKGQLLCLRSWADADQLAAG